MFNIFKTLPEATDDKFFKCYYKGKDGKYIQLNNNKITTTKIIFDYLNPKPYVILVDKIINIIISDEIIEKDDGNYYGAYIKLSLKHEPEVYDGNAYSFHVYFDLFDKIYTENLIKFLYNLKIKFPHKINNNSRIWDYSINNYFPAIRQIYQPYIDYMENPQIDRNGKSTLFKDQTKIDELKKSAMQKITMLLKPTGNASDPKGGNKINKKIKKHRQKSRKKKRTRRIKHTRRRYKK